MGTTWMPQVPSTSSAMVAGGTSAPTLAALCHGVPSLLVPAGSGTEDLTELCVRAGAALRLPYESHLVSGECYRRRPRGSGRETGPPRCHPGNHTAPYLNRA